MYTTSWLIMKQPRVRPIEKFFLTQDYQDVFFHYVQAIVQRFRRYNLDLPYPAKLAWISKNRSLLEGENKTALFYFSDKRNRLYTRRSIECFEDKKWYPSVPQKYSRNSNTVYRYFLCCNRFVRWHYNRATTLPKHLKASQNGLKSQYGGKCSKAIG